MDGLRGPAGGVTVRCSRYSYGLRGAKGLETGRELYGEDRRVGLEQEFFVVDESGAPSDRADAFLERCRDEAREGGDERLVCFAPEFVRNLVEVSTAPAHGLAELEREYARNLQLATRAARALGLRLYPLGTYPLPLEPSVRDEPDYRVQVRTVGPERFVHAGRCAGTHLHLEVPVGTVAPDTGISVGASAGARAEVSNLYNLATALDPALVALTRSCPFYEGEASGSSPRTVRYRGGAAFGWEGVYTDLPSVGALLPYAESIKMLVEQQFDRYGAWLAAMDRAGVERRLFVEAGGDLLRPAWNPVRLNRQGTVELRGMDSNYPEVTLATVALIFGAANRVRGEGLTVLPDEKVRAFEMDGRTLRVPGFQHLSGELLHEAVTGETLSTGIADYLDSILDFVGEDDARLAKLGRRRRADGRYPTTEENVLAEYDAPGGSISEVEGLRLVLDACDELEAQVDLLSSGVNR